jgi:hypothetical protein
VARVETTTGPLMLVHMHRDEASIVVKRNKEDGRDMEMRVGWWAGLRGERCGGMEPAVATARAPITSMQCLVAVAKRAWAYFVY